MNGSMPNDGSDDVEAHVFPNRKGISPIFFIAGMPDIIRYTVISRTHPTVISPSIRNIPWTIDSNNFFLFPALFFIFSPLG